MSKAASRRFSFTCLLSSPSVRLRLAALYGGLFLLCGAALLGIVNVLVRNSARSVRPASIYFSVGSDSPVLSPASSRSDLHTAGGMAKRTSPVAAEHMALLHQLSVQSGIALALMAAVSTVLGWFMAGTVLRPVHTITQSVRQISANNLHRRLELSGPTDELKLLGDTFDDLLARLEAAFDAQRRFVANASHELRTPLTMMRTAVDVAMGKPDPPSARAAALAVKVRRGLDQAERLLEGFLVLARADQAPLSEQSSVSLDRVATATLSECGDKIVAMALTVEQDLAAVVVEGSEVLLGQMVDNVIENAVRHNQPGGWVRVTTGVDGSFAQLIVESSGPILDQRAVGTLTEPFRRLGTPRTASDNGLGLGLSIVAAVAAAHYGALILQARPEGGLRVVVSIPIVSSSGYPEAAV